MRIYPLNKVEMIRRLPSLRGLLDLRPLRQGCPMPALLSTKSSPAGDGRGKGGAKNKRARNKGRTRLSDSSRSRPGFDPRKPLMNNDWLPGDWACEECGTHNPGARKTCQLCGANITATAIDNSRFEVEKWKCVACGFKNDASRTVCYSCRAPKNEPVRTLAKYLSWYCHRCKVYNSDREESCYVCKRTQAECASSSNMGVRRPKIPHELRPGDWICSECSTPNNASNKRCRKCSKNKTQAEVVERAPLNGDWVCSSCNALNYANRTKCYNCNLGNIEEGISIAPNVFKPGRMVNDSMLYNVISVVAMSGLWTAQCSRHIHVRIMQTGVRKKEEKEKGKPKRGGGGEQDVKSTDNSLGYLLDDAKNKKEKVDKKNTTMIRKRVRLFPKIEELFEEHEGDPLDEDELAAFGWCNWSYSLTFIVLVVIDMSNLDGDKSRESAAEEWVCYTCGTRNVGFNPCVVCCPPKEKQEAREPAAGKSSTPH
eukprot:jgi/Bigna1/70289/fgenesh1_pg.11_\